MRVTLMPECGTKDRTEKREAKKLSNRWLTMIHSIVLLSCYIH